MHSWDNFVVRVREDNIHTGSIAPVHLWGIQFQILSEVSDVLIRTMLIGDLNCRN